MSNKYYAGIGSRETPPEILTAMHEVAHKLSRAGYTLRSGGAEGADTAFQEGAASHDPQNLIVYRPRHAMLNHLQHASNFHPAWDKCSDYAKKLHGRNSMIIMGVGLDEPAHFVLCWTLHGALKGGTAQGIRIAKHMGIPVHNLGTAKGLAKVAEFLK